MRIVQHSRKRIREVLEPPNLIEIQYNSYRWFLEEGLKELFQTFSPIYDLTGNYFIEFGDYCLGEPKYSVDECREREITFDAPLRVKVRFGKRDGEVQESEIYLGNLPLMTEGGTFIVNGRERVIISQLNRTPGIHFPSPFLSSTGREMMARTFGKVLQIQIIPAEGPWLDGGTDPQNVIRLKVHQSKQLPITQIIKAFAAYEEARVPAELELERAVGWRILETVEYRGETLLRSGDLLTYERLENFPADIRTLRVKCEPPYDPQLGLTNDAIAYMFGRPRERREILHEATLRMPKEGDLIGRTAAETITNAKGKPIIQANEVFDEKTAKQVAKLKLPEVRVRFVEVQGGDIELPPLLKATLDADPTADSREAVLDFYRRMRPGDPAVEENVRNLFYGLVLDPRRYDLGRVGRYQITRKLRHGIPLEVRRLTVPDLLLALRHLLEMAEEKHEYEDTDHLANKRVRSVGELLQAHLRAAFLKLEKTAREKMTAAEDVSQILPNVVLSVKPVTNALQSFFATNPLSTFMDQTNPLAELANKRRLSVLGPGGLNRQSIPPQVRNITPSQYGRICPIETPEGQNIGLVNQMTLYAYVDEFGFLRTPYRVVRDGKLTDEVVYLPADEDENAYIAPADTPVDENGYLPETVQVRWRDEYPIVPREQVHYMDVNPAQVFSVSATMIAFLEHDDAGRALMGSNMQRQGVPLINPEAPLVFTGVERQAAKYAQSLITARATGRVRYVSATEIRIEREDDGTLEVYKLPHLVQSNKGTCFTFLPKVKLGQRVRAGDVIADGPSTENGELALGRNILVAFLPAGGYNYEDAVFVSQRLLYDDVYTSIHLESHQTDATETKLGPEEITNDIPNVGEEARRDLDENGIIRIGAEVKPEDLLVGKIQPKGQTEGTTEQKLVRIIFGGKAEEMRDVSLRLPHGERGYVVRVTQFARFKYECESCKSLFYRSKPLETKTCPRCHGILRQLEEDELPPSVNHRVRVTVATRRPLTEGDKMAGRHGNKGVISKIQPVEDMPFLMDGTPIDIVLNPLGVPSRMNIGQILEFHLGLVARELGIRFRTPVFQSSTPEEIKQEMRFLADRLRRKALRILLDHELHLSDEDGKSVVWGYRATFDEAMDAVRSVLHRAPESERKRIADRLAFAEKKTPSVDALVDAIRQRAIDRAGFDPETGKVILRDGRTGEPFGNPVAVGYLYLLKLEHLAEEKIHARSIGPYSLVTQQPLGGKAQFGGQRLGEMEVWALEAYGAAHTLQEMLTIKSDDVNGRIHTFEAIIKGAPVIQPSVPESFKILVNELRALALKVQIIDENDVAHDLRSLEELDTLDEPKPKPLLGELPAGALTDGNA
ncbi:MAG: DNA-directed RNA polymerase subunit beta [Armatimonadetes bacterium JP3_11]|nr:MAG: DNA-directed RNA polymerase subunit beta [Armatimonadetes bacterium CP1_7O]OYT75635.1 MAG: DNA-directed RNA polymerase subunit beta [Armatimonadetes bacterium JP3_11]RMH08565.1 MAG: DNA-directed RNA polymerase subunit beta [Armatimonadota bacterium]